MKQEPTALPKADTAWWQQEGDKPSVPFQGMVRQSRYLTMRDRVRIAIDVYLPRSLEGNQRLPTILHQTRYFRRTDLNWPFSWLRRKPNQTILRFIEGGYAWVSVDVRGSGASFGSRDVEWSPDEVADGAEVVDWIVEQPWSNGIVGTTGISYDGTCAERLLSMRHPAVKAAIIRYSLFDVYEDILRPCGVHNERFMRTWDELNTALDADRLAAFTRKWNGLLPALAIRGVAPVDEDTDRALLKAATQEHRDNYDIYGISSEIEFRDDATSTGLALDGFSPHAFHDRVTAGGPAVYSWSGWYDGRYTLSAIKRFLNVHTPGTRLILGPWDHGGGQNPDPLSVDYRSRFDHTGEMLRFFDHHLKGIETGIESEAPVWYYTMGEEAWKSADTWPPPGFEHTPFFLAANRSLRAGAPPLANTPETVQTDDTTGSGLGSRWFSQVNVNGSQIRYDDRKERDQDLLVYASRPFERDTELTGHPIVTLYIRSSVPDAQFFLYLEDLDEDGQVTYVTEGLFRAIHRKMGQDQPPYRTPVPYHTYRREDAQPLVPGEVAELTFDLIPISFLFGRGHAIRLVIALADRDNFAQHPPSLPEIEILCGSEHPSHILLPLSER